MMITRRASSADKCLKIRRRSRPVAAPSCQHCRQQYYRQARPRHRPRRRRSSYSGSWAARRRSLHRSTVPGASASWRRRRPTPCSNSRTAESTCPRNRRRRRPTGSQSHRVSRSGRRPPDCRWTSDQQRP